MKKKVGRPCRFDGDKKIFKKVDDNPRRKGTFAHNNFKLFRNGVKVSTYLKKGGDMRELRYNVDKGHIEVK